MITPHGGTLINRLPQPGTLDELTAKANSLPQLTIANRYVSDIEMIANGGFSPLTGFMTKADAQSVIEKKELANGLIWSIPIVLPLPQGGESVAQVGETIALFDEHQRPVALFKVEEIFELDLDQYCCQIFATAESVHPGVAVVQNAGNRFIGGEIITMINRPHRTAIDEGYYVDPANVRQLITDRGWSTVVAFQTRNPIHRAHEYLIKCALESVDGALIHPLVGETKSDDIPADVRMECYEVLINKYFNPDHVILSALPANMNYAGPVEAIHHMIMRKNYGCTHMIIGRDHAGVGNYYGTYDAQVLVDSVVEKLGIQPIKYEHTFYCNLSEGMASAKTAPKTDNPKEDRVFLSGTQVRDMLSRGQRPPKEFSRPEVADVLIEWATANHSPKELVGTKAGK